MIRWCAYCQSFMGQSEPFSDFSFTHGICRACQRSENNPRREGRPINAIEAWFNSTFRHIQNGSKVDPLHLVNESRYLKIPTADLFLGILHPLLVKVGRYFEIGQLSPEKEHRFSESVQQVIDAVSGEHTVALNPPIVLFLAEGNQHSIGLKFLQLLLFNEKGIHAQILDTPPRSLEEYEKILETSPKVIGVSLATPDQWLYVARLIEWHKQQPRKKPHLMIGGAGLSLVEPSQLANLDSDVFLSDVNDVKSTLELVDHWQTIHPHS